MANGRRNVNIHALIQVILAIALITADQVTKLLAVCFLKDNDPYILIEGVLELKYLENTGAAFGIFQNKQWLFYIITGVIAGLVVLFWFMIISRLKKYCRFGIVCPNTFCRKTYNDMIGLAYILTMLFAGAIGNLIDRVANQYVVDFIYFSIINFPVFNFADILVTVSAVMLIIFFIFIYKEDEYFRFLGKKKD